MGSVLNLASRLSDKAGPGQILMSARAYAATEDAVDAERIPDLKLKGFAKPVMAFSLKRLTVKAPGERSRAVATDVSPEA